MTNNEFLRELRCNDCRKLLFKEYIYKGRVEVRCEGCKTINTFNFRYYKGDHTKNDIMDVEQGAIDPQ